MEQPLCKHEFRAYFNVYSFILNQVIFMYTGSAFVHFKPVMPVHLEHLESQGLKLPKQIFSA